MLTPDGYPETVLPAPWDGLTFLAFAMAVVAWDWWRQHRGKR